MLFRPIRKSERYAHAENKGGASEHGVFIPRTDFKH